MSDGLGDLPDLSREASDAHLAEAKSLRADAERLAGSELSFDESLDLDLARLMLDFEIEEHQRVFNGATRAQQLPCAGDGIGDPLFMLFIADPRPPVQRLQDMTSRLQQVPRFLGQLQARLTTPLERWASIEQQKLSGLPSLFDNLQAWAESIEFSGLEDFLSARKEAEEAISAYQKWLADQPTTTQLHVGDAVARNIVKNRGINLSLEQIHQVAKNFLAENQAEQRRLRDVLVQRYDLPESTTVAELHEWLNVKFKVQIREGELEDVLTRYQAERERILAFIKERDLFPVFEGQDMKILRTPAFLEASIPAGAMVAPAPFRDGVRTSLVYLTLSEELLDEHTELGIPTMMIHEGIPGHHLHLATASTHTSVIRRHCESMDQAEGWTTMLEDYMLNMGYMGELTDEARFIGKRDIARIGARVAIDLFFMTGDKSYLDVGVDTDLSSDDPFVAAGNLLQEVTGFTGSRVQAELNWYSIERGYPLSYLTGNFLMMQLKSDIASAWTGEGGLALDRAFHKAFLEAGNMPIAQLRDVMKEEGLLR